MERKPINVMFGLTDIDLENILFSDLPDEFTLAAEDEDNYVTVCIDGADNRPACPVCGQTAYWMRRKPNNKRDLSAFAAGIRDLGPIKAKGDRYPTGIEWVCDCGARFQTPVRPFANYVVVLTKQGHTTIDAPSDWEPRRAS